MTPSPVLTLVTLVTGPDANARENVIAERLTQLRAKAVGAAFDVAVIFEGLADGAPDPISGVTAARIAAGCPCCSGNLVMRVTLDRMLQRKPQRLYVSLATTEHLARIRVFLTQPPYSGWITLTDDIAI